jgi:hypothetical protein
MTRNHVHLQTNRIETPKPYLFTSHNATIPAIYSNARKKAAPKTPLSMHTKTKAHQLHPNVLFIINGADARNPIHTTISN